MRRTKLLKYVREKQTPSLCLIDDEYYDRKSPAEVYGITFTTNKDGIRCYDLANNYKLISYAQDDSDLDTFRTGIENVTDRIDAICFYEFYKTKKQARQRLEERKNDLDRDVYRRLKSDLRTPI
jgi:hypothetical protein